MLVLSRKFGESVVISLSQGEDIIVTVLENDRGRVQLGFETPREIEINRVLAERRIES